MTHKLIHLNSSRCEIDKQEFSTEQAMENYIDLETMAYWQEGDKLICDGASREILNVESLT